MATILVTGGRGFIGTNLTMALRSRGHDVWTCDIFQGEDSQHLRADVGVYQQIDAIFRHHKFDYVYHLAAEYGRWSGVMGCIWCGWPGHSCHSGRSTRITAKAGSGWRWRWS